MLSRQDKRAATVLCCCNRVCGCNRSCGRYRQCAWCGCCVWQDGKDSAVHAPADKDAVVERPSYAQGTALRACVYTCHIVLLLRAHISCKAWCISSFFSVVPSKCDRHFSHHVVMSICVRARVCVSCSHLPRPGRMSLPKPRPNRVRSLSCCVCVCVCVQCIVWLIFLNFYVSPLSPLCPCMHAQTKATLRRIRPV